jgi:glucan phosphoethanolaminetransferase (alkaline phosphatase superfamily)
MRERGHGALGRRVAIEALAWCCAAGLFIAAYVGVLGGRPDGILPHLRLVAEAVLALAAIRVGFSAVLPPRIARVVSTALAMTGFAILVAYYLLEVIALKSWGRVITWDLIVAHGRGTPLMFDAMGLPPWILVVAAVLVAVALLALAWLHMQRLDWVGLLAGRTRRLPRGAAALALLAVVAVNLHEYLLLPPLDQREPVSLTFFSERRAIKVQSHGVDLAAAERRDAQQDAARAAYQAPPNAARRNVVVIVGDALRADHMDLYGYARETTPHLAKLRAEGVLRVAPAAHAVCSETSCGLLGLLSSRYVHQFSGRMFMLPEVLKRNGYRTALILGGDHTHFYGLRELYGPVDEYYDGSLAGGYYMNDDQLVVDYVNRLPDWDGRPVMIRFHLMSSHMLGKRHEANTRYEPAANYFFVPNRTLGEDGKTYEKAVNYYDNGVREFDSVAASLIDTLRRKHYLDSAVVAITGDHGESVGEHGLWGHENGLTEEAVRVPFLLLHFGYQPQSTLDSTPWPSQVDIAPTILAELGIPRPATWSGMPLQAPVHRDFIQFEEGPLVGLLDTRDARNPWKYWEDRIDGKASAFNLARDPHESRNAVEEVPAQLRRDWRRELVPAKAQYVRDPWKL